MPCSGSSNVVLRSSSRRLLQEIAMTHALAVCGCFLAAPIVRTFARMLSIGSQTTYSRMKIKVVGGGERMWQGIMSRAMRSENGERRWHHWVRRTLLSFTLGNLGFSR
jgi:hypothetical protein